MLSSLDTVSSLSDETLLWPGRKVFSVVKVCQCSWFEWFDFNTLTDPWSQAIKDCMGTSAECKRLSVVMCVGMIFDFCVPWLSLRSWVCRGQPAVCCWGWAAQRCQGKQISVGAAAERPEAVHGENDTPPLLCLPSTPSQKGFTLSSTWEEGAYRLPTVCACVVGARVLALLSLPPLPGSHSQDSSLIQSAAEQRFTVERSAYPEFRWVLYLPSVQHGTAGSFTHFHLAQVSYKKNWLKEGFVRPKIRPAVQIYICIK